MELKPETKKSLVRTGIIVPLLLVFLLSVSLPASGEVKTTFMYTLSNFTGPIPFDWARIYNDPSRKELYAISGDSIRIFNDRGMETYRFGTYDLDYGAIYDITVDKGGDIIYLCYKDGKYSVNVSNFRGEPKGQIEIRELPKEFEGFGPNRIFLYNGLFYLVSLQQLRVAVVDKNGDFKKGYDIAPLIGVKDDERKDNDLYGFSMDAKGNMLFTSATLGLAYIMSPEGVVKGFGKRGSAPGKFGIPKGIAEDSAGNFFVADTLRSVVLIFDKDYRFVSEFGGRGFRRENLMSPQDVVIDGQDRLYVTQMRKRGVSVFQIKNN